MADRRAILDRMKGRVARGEPIVGGGAGTGISAKSLAGGGADFIVVYNSGRYRMAGHGSLAGLMPYGDANATMLEMVDEVRAVAEDTPVMAGICGTDPMRSMDLLLDEVIRRGCAGVQNFPTVGLIDGTFRRNLEETGMSYRREVDMMAKAHGKGLIVVPYVFTPDEARMMALAGADILVVHFGLTSGGSIGAETVLSLEDSIPMMDACTAAALAVNPDLIVLCHGGAVAMPADAEYVIGAAATCHGFLGASSMERLPTEIAITRTTREFKNLSLPMGAETKRGTA
ncbi:MAG: phosphoenolpyruvate hydrolase family protein [Shimia sp.]